MNSQLWVYKKKIVFKFASMKNEWYSRAAGAALNLARDCKYLNAFALTYTSVRRISFGFWSFFFNFWYLWKENQIRFPYSRTHKTHIFFTNSKMRVHYTCVLKFNLVACTQFSYVCDVGFRSKFRSLDCTQIANSNEELAWIIIQMTWKNDQL